jgi:hypothetical protein
MPEISGPRARGLDHLVIMESPMSRSTSRVTLLGIASLMSLAVTAGCTGLAAGPVASAQTPVPVSRDTAWARTRRALTSDAFTLDVVDSTHGHLVGTRYASANAKQGTTAACRMTLDLNIRGDAQQAELASTSRWVAPQTMQDKAPEVCDRERTDVLDRINTTVAPPAQ